MTLLQKHTELNQIDSALDRSSIYLSEALEGALDEDNRKIMLTLEEDIMKAMLQTDSVGCSDNLIVRQRRRELIKKGQNMLRLLDNYMHSETNGCKDIDHDTTEASSKTSEASEHDGEVEAVPADIDGALPEPKPNARVHEQEDEDQGVEDMEVPDSKPTTAEAESDAGSEEETTDEPTNAIAPGSVSDGYEYL